MLLVCSWFLYFLFLLFFSVLFFSSFPPFFLRLVQAMYWGDAAGLFFLSCSCHSSFFFFFCCSFPFSFSLCSSQACPWGEQETPKIYMCTTAVLLEVRRRLLQRARCRSRLWRDPRLAGPGRHKGASCRLCFWCCCAQLLALLALLIMDDAAGSACPTDHG